MGDIWKPISHLFVINNDEVDCLEKKHFRTEVTAPNHPAKVPAVEGGQGAVGHTRIPRSVSAPWVLPPSFHASAKPLCSVQKCLKQTSLPLGTRESYAAFCASSTARKALTGPQPAEGKAESTVPMGESCSVIRMGTTGDQVKTYKEPLDSKEGMLHWIHLFPLLKYTDFSLWINNLLHLI